MFMPLIVDIKKAVVFGGESGEGRQKVEKLSNFADSIIMVPENPVDYSYFVLKPGPLKHCSENLYLKKEKRVEVQDQGFSYAQVQSLIHGASYVVSDLSDASANAYIFELCQKQNILCTVIDNKQYSNTYFASLIHEPPITVSFSTAGACAFYARKCREELEPEIKSRSFVARVLTDLRNSIPPGPKRKGLLEIIYADKEFQNILLTHDFNKAIEKGMQIIGGVSVSK